MSTSCKFFQAVKDKCAGVFRSCLTVRCAFTRNLKKMPSPSQTPPGHAGFAAGISGRSGVVGQREDRSVPPEASPALIGQQEILLFGLSRLKILHLMNGSHIFSQEM